jgi:hypothetical protein
MAFDFMNFDLNKDVAQPPVDPFVDKDGRPLNQMEQAEQPPARRPSPSRVIRPLGTQPMDFASLGPAGQMNTLNSMTGDINNVIDREMGSRVMQAREERQRQHEKELMMMRLRMMKAQSDGDIIRSLLNG